MKTSFARRCLCVAFALAIFSSAHAENVYLNFAAKDLTITDGKWPDDAKLDNWWQGQVRSASFFPYAALDGDGEIYFGFKNENLIWPDYASLCEARDNGTLSIRTSAAHEISGTLYVPRRDLTGMAALKFKVSNPKSADGARAEFYKAKAAHFQRLLNRNIPGAAWFRHARDEADAAVGDKHADPNANIRPRGIGLQESYELFSGGRAVSENLQLDRTLRLPKPAEATVDVNSIESITVKEADWKTLNKDAAPKFDALAGAIPQDQHAVFFPSFQGMLDLSDEADNGARRSCSFMNRAPKMRARASAIIASFASTRARCRASSGRTSSRAWRLPVPIRTCAPARMSL